MKNSVFISILLISSLINSYAQSNGINYHAKDIPFMMRVQLVVTMWTGAGMAIGGSIASVVCIGRIIRVQSVLNKKYPSLQGLNISPEGGYNYFTKSFCPGIKLTYRF